jgi:hypothetical protein
LARTFNSKRLTFQTFSEKYPKTQEAYVDLQSILSPKSQYARYREVLSSLPLPTLPFPGVVLTDITFIDLGNSDLVKMENDKWLNMDKRRKVVKAIWDMLRRRNGKFPWRRVEAIEDFLMNLDSPQATWPLQPILADDALYAASLSAEPPVEEE